MRECTNYRTLRFKQLIAVGLLAPSLARAFVPELTDLANLATIIVSLVWLWEM